MEQDICLKCQHLEQRILPIYKDYWNTKPKWQIGESIHYYCHAQLKYIRKMRKKCQHYSPYTQTRLNIGEDGMVKTDEIPSEGARMDLNNLPAEVDLKALEEKTVAESSGKSGGLQITFQNRQGVKVTQKYTPISGAVLQTACRKLGIKDTIELGESWYHYKLTDMRMGYARFIPVEKCKKQ